jgi:hypothetical protein
MKFSIIPYGLLLFGWGVARIIGTEVFPSTLSLVIGIVASRSIAELITKRQITTLQDGILVYANEPIKFILATSIICSCYFILLLLTIFGFNYK